MKLSKLLNTNNTSKHTKRLQTKETKPTFKKLLRLNVKPTSSFPETLPLTFLFTRILSLKLLNPQKPKRKSPPKPFSTNQEKENSLSTLSSTTKNPEKKKNPPLSPTSGPLLYSLPAPLDHLLALMNGQDLPKDNSARIWKLSEVKFLQNRFVPKLE